MRIIHLLLIFSLHIMLHSEARTITIATSPWPPYADCTLPGWGFTTEIIRAAFGAVGYDTEFIIDDWYLVLEKAKKGEYDALYNCSITNSRKEFFYYSDPYSFTEITLVCKKEKDIKFKVLSDLKPYRIGLLKGYAEAEPFMQDSTFINREYIDDLSALQALFKDEIDLLPMNKFVCLHILKNSAFVPAGPEEVKFLTPTVRLATLHIMFPKIVTGYKAKAAYFNKGLKLIMENGTFDEIIDKFGFREYFKEYRMYK